MINKLLKKISAINSMTGDAVSFVKLFFFYLYLHPVWDSTGRRSLSIKFRLNAFGNSCTFYVDKLEDLATLEGIFIKQEYDNELQNVKSIIDLGSNIGASVAYFKLRYPEAQVIAVEAEPSVFKKLQRNTRELSNVSLLQAAVGSSSGSIDFYTNPNRSISGSMTNRGEGYEIQKVPVRTLDSIVEEFNFEQIDIVKFNIEGGEIDVFKNCSSINQIRLVIGGVHVDLIPDYSQVESLLEAFNSFDIKKIPRAKGRFLLHAVNNKTS